MKDTDRVEAGLEVLAIAIQTLDSSVGYMDMAVFIDTVSNPYLRAHLERAINRREPFRNFKDVLLDYPGERERWYQFQREQLHTRVLEWLKAHDIVPEDTG